MKWAEVAYAMMGLKVQANFTAEFNRLYKPQEQK